MRVTNSMMARLTMYNLDQIRNRLYSIQTDLATGTRLHKPSDDPAGTVESMRLNSGLARLERYEQNISDAKSRLDRTDTALDQITTVVQRIRELVVQNASETVPTEARRASAAEVSKLLEALVDLGNSEYAGRYIFGGQQSGSQPFVTTVQQAKVIPDGSGGWSIVSPADPTPGEVFDQYTVTYNGPATPVQEQIFREIAPGVTVQVNVGGQELRTPKNEDLFQRVQTIVDHMMTDRTDLLSTEDIQALADIEDGLLGLRAAVGARSQTVELAGRRATDLRVTLESHKEQVEGIDIAKSLIEFNKEETAYQTALGISGRILPPTLLDFLR